MAANIFGSRSNKRSNSRTEDKAPSAQKPAPPEKQEEAPSSPPPVKPLFKRTFTLEYTLPTLITVSIFMLFAVGFIFAFGLMIGHGYNPEEEMPEIAALIPEAQEEIPQPQNEILRPEDLEFMTALKKDEMQAENEPPLEEEGTEEVLELGLEASPDLKPDLTQNTEQHSGEIIMSPQEGPATIQPTELLLPQESTIYNFTYQVIAYKQKDNADSLAARLKAAGFQSIVQSVLNTSGQAEWYRVYITFRATEEQAKTAIEGLSRFGIRDTLLISKKAVE